jgi:transcriptional regulator with GAF, ATPase, and Fis domain
MQVSLLRFIQELEFRAVGALKWRKVDLQIIAATHRELKTKVAAGRFRLDQFRRLNVVVIRLAPLRDRKEEVPLSIDYFPEASGVGGCDGFRPSPEVLEVLSGYDWPGNVREL